jgi:FG-GAP repeat/Bacterial Ig domain
MPGIRLVDVRAALAALGLAGLAALAVAITTHLPVPAASGPATHATSAGLSRLQSLPMQAQSVISSTVGGGSRAYAAHRIGSGWQLNGGGVRADLRGGAPTLTAAGGKLALSLRGAPVTSVTAHGNRVTLVRPGVREWYAAGPLGIEQGFTLTRRLDGSTLTLGIGGTLRPQLTASGITFVDRHGQVVLRYGGLTTVDASGQRLPSRLEVRNGRVAIAVNDRGARYPITIDPLVQQSGKLVGNDLQTNGSGSQFGDSVALSADGNMALIGGQIDNSSKGAAWVFVRSGSSWGQLGSKIVPPDETTSSQFGTSVALSGDGGTALIGGNLDGGTGAAWVYVRSGSSWAEQRKLPATGLTGADKFGQSVALSFDGNTAIIGGPGNDGSAGAGHGGGAAWVFTRSGTTWTQQGPPISPTVGPMNNNSAFGTAVALSSDGNIAFIGGPQDGPGSGTVWAYTRSGATWSPQQALNANDEAGFPGLAHFGAAIDLSSDGNTALIGGPDDNNSIGGAAWVFTRSGTTWSQQGGKLLPTNANGGNAQFGNSVALSSDGNTALIGSDQDANNIGAAYVFTRSGSVWTQQQRMTGAGETGFGFFGSGVALASDGQTAMIGAQGDTSETGAAFAFAPPNPVCNSVSATGPQGGGSVAVSLSCTLPFGARPNFSILGGPSNGSVSGFNASSGQLIYTSAAFFSGEDSFTYRVSDQWGISNIATATLHIPFLPGTTCLNVTAKGKRGATRVTVTLKCKGPKGHRFSYGIVSKPSSGKLGKINQSNGQLTYRTHVGFSGNDRFVYDATNSGGSSKPATATIVLPRLGRITSTMTWGEFLPGPTSTVLPGMLVKSLPGGAKVKLSCKGQGCPVKPQTTSLAKTKVCTGKGNKRKCRLVVPKSGNLDLTRFVAHRRVKVGYQIIVAMIQPGSIGKQYVFTMVKRAQPSIKIQTLAPGSTRLCPTC